MVRFEYDRRLDIGTHTKEDQLKFEESTETEPTIFKAKSI